MYSSYHYMFHLFDHEIWFAYPTRNRMQINLLYFNQKNYNVFEYLPPNVCIQKKCILTDGIHLELCYHDASNSHGVKLFPNKKRKINLWLIAIQIKIKNILLFYSNRYLINKSSIEPEVQHMVTDL